jgi:lysophospholipase L1-like esterase
MPQLSDFSIRVGSSPVVAAYLRGVNLYDAPSGGGGAVYPAPVYPASIIPIGDSITASTSTGSWVDPAVLMSNGALRMVRNAGIGGNTTQQMIDRFSADVAAFASDEVWIQAGTNDVGVITPAVFSARLGTLIDLAIATGRVVRVFNIPPRNTNITGAADFRITIPAVCAEKNVAHYDLWSGSVDPDTGGFLDGDHTDGTHPSNAGFQKAVTALMSALSVPTTPRIELPTVNSTAQGGLMANPLLLTDTNADGVPDEWAKSGSSSSVATLFPSVSGFGNTHRLSGDLTGSKDLAINVSPYKTVVAGRSYRVRLRMSAQVVNSIWALRIRWLTSTSVDVSSAYPLNCIVNAAGEWEGVFVAPPTAARFGVQIRAYAAAGAPAASAEVEIERVSVTDLGVL